MKKWIAILLCLITLFSLAACGKREAEQITVQLVSGQTYGTGKLADCVKEAEVVAYQGEPLGALYQPHLRGDGGSLMAKIFFWAFVIAVIFIIVPF